MPGYRRISSVLGCLIALGLGGCGSSTQPSDRTAPSGTSAASSAGAGATDGGGVAANGGGEVGTTSGGAPPDGGTAGTTETPVDCGTPSTAAITVAWDNINKQPPAFYASAEARALADNILYYQNVDHGWPKNIDMTSRTAEPAGSTIDNRATTTQLEFLARTYQGSQCPQYRDAVLGAIEFLLSAQYENGGWPQIYPDPTGYHKHITFNDDAMIHVLLVLRAIGTGTPPYDFVDETVRESARAAVAKGVECVLACQIKMDGGQRGWCAQHDEVTLEPAQARTYELPSVSGSEGAQIVRFLMTIDPPTPEIREAVEGAVAWFEANELTGIRVQTTVDPSQPSGEDRVVVEDPNAPPLWARFYELGTNRPIFSSRCEVPECDTDPFFMRRYSLAEIDNERRVGYAWYGTWPAAVLSEYQAWKVKYP
ncbi:MAG: pectate lyase [Myxococcales bacterium]